MQAFQSTRFLCHGCGLLVNTNCPFGRVHKRCMHILLLLSHRYSSYHFPPPLLDLHTLKFLTMHPPLCCRSLCNVRPEGHGGRGGGNVSAAVTVLLCDIGADIRNLISRLIASTMQQVASTLLPILSIIKMIHWNSSKKLPLKMRESMM
jgi:hypothetical protein